MSEPAPHAPAPHLRPHAPAGEPPPYPAPADQVAPPSLPPAPQPQPSGYAPERYIPTNAYAILAIVFACFVLPPVGIYLGGKAKQQIAESGERGIELANLAVVLGWIFTVLQVVIVLLVCDIFGTVILTAASRGSSF